MVKLVRLYDSGKVSASIFGVLIAAGCADIALALARRQGPQQLSPQQEAAMKAAAGQWQPAVAAALQAHQQLLLYPKYVLGAYTHFRVDEKDKSFILARKALRGFRCKSATAADSRTA